LSALSIRETRPLLLLASFRHLCQSQIAEFLFAGLPFAEASKPVLTRRILRRLLGRGLIASVPRPSSEPGGASARLAYVLTRAGHAVAQSLTTGLPRWQTSRSTFLVSHSLATADVALAFHRAARSRPNHEVIAWHSDWQSALRLGPSRVVPDAHLVYATANYEIDAFVETDMGTEGTRFFGRKIASYLDLYRSGTWQAQLRTWPVILTVTPNAARAAALRRATESVLSAERDSARVVQVTEFRFAHLTDVLGRVGPLGEIWQVACRRGPRSLLSDSRIASEEHAPIVTDESGVPEAGAAKYGGPFHPVARVFGDR